MIRKICLLTALLLFAIHNPSKGQVVPKPVDIPRYPCLHTDKGQDSLHFPKGRSAFKATFYTKLNTLLQTGQGRVNILHIGGSHVQAGFFSHRVRVDLDSISPSVVGDRGMLFPFSALKTNTPQSYSFTSSGTWSGQRCIMRELTLPLGLSGASVTTRDTLGCLTLALCDLSLWKPSVLRLLGEGEDERIVPVLVCGNDTISASAPDGKPGYTFQLPLKTDTCRIAFRDILQDSLGFTLRGVLPEGSDNGITYTASGINGAAVPSWLRCSKFEEELSLLPPDLVVFGIGINDANVLPHTFDVEKFKDNYRELIRRIRSVNPSCCFLFITNNDCWFNVKGRRRQFNTNTHKVQRAMKQLAREYGGAVFDVFAMMGGLRSSSAWVRTGLQRPDHIHFTREGYELWGDLLYNALINDYNHHFVKD